MCVCVCVCVCWATWKLQQHLFAVSAFMHAFILSVSLSDSGAGAL